MKPVINLNEINDFEESHEGNFGEQYAGVSKKVGAKKLGYSITGVPPGKKCCPFHNHRINEEMFLVLSGTGILRFGDTEYPDSNKVLSMVKIDDQQRFRHMSRAGDAVDYYEGES